MQRLDGYLAGVNLGHWISQYGGAGEEHFDAYITASDFCRIAKWGCDHVRLPVDYFFFCNGKEGSEELEYSEERLKYVDFTVEECAKSSLNLVLDLHHAPGFFFGDGDKNDLFTNRKSQEKFIGIWRMFAERYRASGDELTFELLNELVWKDSEAWNALWKECAAEIHKIDPKRKIVIGGNYWNSVGQLQYLDVVRDDRIIYNFHMYEPFVFTHQRASWMENTREYKKPVAYPFEAAEHAAFYGGSLPDSFKGLDVIDKRFLERFLEPAFEFIDKNKRPLYCGEYGVIANADTDSAIRWVNDLASVFAGYGIGRAFWSYRGFAALTDGANNAPRMDYVEAVARK